MIKLIWSKLLSGRSFLILLLFLVSISTVGCTGNPLSLLTGGGPNVAANTQIGKENNQTLGISNRNAPSVSVRPKARVDKVDQSVTENKTNQADPLLVILLILGWIAPSPSEIARGIRSLFTTKRKP